MNDHKRMKTYKRMKRFSLSINAKILSSKLMFKMKKNLHDVIKKFKIRWCAREYEQIHDIDFNETYASIIKSMTYKILFVMMIHHDLKIEQMKIVIVFLNAVFKERNIFIEFSKNYENSNYVWMLIRTFYDLKQSSREWYETLSKWLLSQSFVRLKSNHFVFINKKIEFIVSIYVDDLLIIESKKFA